MQTFWSTIMHWALRKCLLGNKMIPNIKNVINNKNIENGNTLIEGRNTNKYRSATETYALDGKKFAKVRNFVIWSTR